MARIRASLASSWGSTGNRVAPPDLCRLHIVRDDVLDGTGLARLGNGKRAGVCGEKRGCNAGENKTSKDGDGQDVLLDLLAALRLSRAKDDALDAVVDTAACFEGVGVWGGGEVVQVRLEEPEGLAAGVSRGRQRGRGRGGRTSSAPLTDSSQRSMMNSSRAMDSLSMLMSRWHSWGKKNSSCS